MSRLWRSQPLHSLVIEILRKKQGTMIDSDLLKELRGVDEDISLGDMMETLMKLEVDGLIHVYSLTKNRNRVELARA
jgi:Fe2+ or Zn2+ uptake regulation protein